MDTDLLGLAKDIEAALALDDDLVKKAKNALAQASEDAASVADLESTDDVISLVYAIHPGWHLSMKGTATMPNGHWRCTLRKSDLRDNDALIGIGNGPTLPHALLAAVLKAMAQAAH